MGSFATLIPTSSSSVKCRVKVQPPEFSIGRGLHNQFIVENLAISRVHCTFKFSNGWKIIDKSSNGTYVNKQKIKKFEEHSLENNDIIRMGEDVSFTFCIVEPVKCKKSKMDAENDEKVDEQLNTKEKKIKLNHSSNINDMLVHEKSIIECEYMSQVTDLLEQFQQQKHSGNSEQINKEHEEKLKQLEECKDKQMKQLEEKFRRLQAEKDEYEKRLQKEIDDHLEQEQKLRNEMHELKSKYEEELTRMKHVQENKSSSTENLLQQNRNLTEDLIELKMVMALKEAEYQEAMKLSANIETAVPSTSTSSDDPGSTKQSIGIQGKITKEILKLEWEKANLVKSLEDIPLSSLAEHQTKIKEIDKKIGKAIQKRTFAMEHDYLVQPEPDPLDAHKEAVETTTSKAMEQASPAENTTELVLADVIEEEFQCSICSEVFIKAKVLNCSHTFCEVCISQWRKTKNICPICRSRITTETHSLVVDNCIEKMIQKFSSEYQEKRKQIVEERNAIAESSKQKKPAKKATRRNNTEQPYFVSAPIEVSSDDSDASDFNEDSFIDDELDDDDYEYYLTGRRTSYFGGYGHCFTCGAPDHWSNACPRRRRR